MSAALSLAALPAAEGATRTPPTEALPIPGDPGDGRALITPDERAAGFPAEKERRPPAGHGHGITAEDMAWMDHYQRRYFARLERVRGLST